MLKLRFSVFQSKQQERKKLKNLRLLKKLKKTNLSKVRKKLKRFNFFLSDRIMSSPPFKRGWFHLGRSQPDLEVPFIRVSSLRSCWRRCHRDWLRSWKLWLLALSRWQVQSRWPLICEANQYLYRYTFAHWLGISKTWCNNNYKPCIPAWCCLSGSRDSNSER